MTSEQLLELVRQLIADNERLRIENEKLRLKDEQLRKEIELLKRRNAPPTSQSSNNKPKKNCAFLAIVSVHDLFPSGNSLIARN
jgi:hypothetical protein